ncbi:MAG: ABC transporter ATP-binding protein [Clostridia bacterium]|nr:ABC transporter ATP-binding protein [Clostridia bacterium]
MKQYHKRNRAAFFGTLFCILLSNAFAVVLQFFKGDVLDYAVAGEIHATVKYILLLISFILGEVLFFYLYKRCTARYVVGCARLLKRDVFESILHRSYTDYKARQQGEYIAKLTNEADAIRERRFQMLPMFFDILFKIVFVSTALFLLDWRLALITIALLSTPLYIPKLIEKRLQNAQTEYLKAVEDTLKKVNDWLNGFEIIKNFSVEKQILKRFGASNDLAMEKLRRDTTLGAVSQLITTLISYLSYFIVLVFAAWLVLKGAFSAGNFFVAIGMIDQLSYPLISLAEIIRQLTAIRPACEAMERFIAEASDDAAGNVLQSVNDEIRYRDVSFSYPNGAPILSHFDFCAKRGKKYLMQGPSGCGKTTAVNLLLRYHDANEGSITVDGVPISAFTSTYACMTVVRQEAVLFCDTLRNNLTLYREIPDETLIAMLRDLGLSRFADPESLDSIIAENGANLSGGEKKRICLARALLRDTDVLILDEPLANLDDATAGKIEDLLLKITGKLLLVVSHQFSEEKLRQFDGVLILRR